MNSKIDFAAARLDPARVFARPLDIVQNAELTFSQKLDLLERWKQDATHLQTASGEAMTGGEPNRLDEVVHALNALKKGAASLAP